MEYIQDKKLYSNGTLIAYMAEQTSRSIKKIALQKELGSFTTFCIKEGKNIVYTMRYWKRKYLIFNFFVESIDNECAYIMSKYI